MSKLKLFICILVLPLLAIACGNDKNTVDGPGDRPAFKVLGYLFSHGNWAADMANIDFTKITDLNIAFINPDEAGNFTNGESLRPVVEKAHQNHVKVFFSIGGGDPPAHLAGLLEAGKRPTLVAAIAAFAKQYHFDGVDVDLENALVNSNYAPFVYALAMALKPDGKLLTSALASWNGNQIADSTLQRYDFINIMSYDKTGPWNTANPGPHSPYEMVENDFNYYRGRNIAAGKLLIGLPFYGYGFGGGAPESMVYKNLVIAYPGAENKDEVELPGGGKIYYNGIPTIQRKVNFALASKAAGVMIWELQQDSKDATSLLGAIRQVVGQ